MFYGKRFLALTIVFSLATFSTTSPVSAQQQTRTNDSWLNRPLVNWNRSAASFPRLPRPPAMEGEPATVRRCRETVRQPARAADRSLVRRGWTLYGPVQSFGTTMIVTAMASVDGMCRPLGYQAFVYVEGRYAGTLSPIAMNSRTDGSLTDIRLVSPTRITAEFARYAASDPLCCPSRTSAVLYNIRPDEIPELTPTNVATRATCQTSGSEGAEGSSNTAATSLFGRRWMLTEIQGSTVRTGEPYIEFDREQGRLSGNGGCNRFSGVYEITGATMRLSRIISTKRACLDDEANRIETTFLQLLETTTRFEIQAGTLRLYAGERPTLAFTSS